MNKYLIKILLLIFISFVSASAETINSTDISGNKRISNESIIVLGQINLNDEFDDNKLNSILKNLYDTNFFSNVVLSVENNILKIDVIENPIIENIEITGITNKKILEDVLENIQLKERMSFTENALKKDIDLIKNIHKSAGYYFVDVVSSVNKDENLNSIILKLDVIQGQRAKIKDIFLLVIKKLKIKNC